MFPKYQNENIKQYEQCLLPKMPDEKLMINTAGNAAGENPVSPFNPSSLVLPPILSFGGQLQYPSSMIQRGIKDLDYFNMFPPLNFNNHQFDKSFLIQQHQHRLTTFKENPIANIVRELKNNKMKRPQEMNNLEIPQKKAKFDFSIEALTAKPDNNKSKQPLQEINQNSMVSDSTNNEIFRAISTNSIKSRGRPSADLIEVLKQNSMQNPHRYSCSVCHRSFPRKKSLDTHRLTHSDVKPYACDFPGCNRKFKQSGQLKTHLRLHTGEKPFKCTYPYCETAFTHANRKCSLHPNYPLHRSSTDTLSENQFKNLCYDKLSDSENVEKVRSWFEKHMADRESKLNENKENIPPNNNAKSSEIKNDEEEIIDIESDESHRIPYPIEENNKRLLSAVALVELRDQLKEPSNKKENYNKLFSTNHSF